MERRPPSPDIFYPRLPNEKRHGSDDLPPTPGPNDKVLDPQSVYYKRFSPRDYPFTNRDNVTNYALNLAPLLPSKQRKELTASHQRWVLVRARSALGYEISFKQNKPHLMIGRPRDYRDVARDLLIRIRNSLENEIFKDDGLYVTDEDAKSIFGIKMYVEEPGCDFVRDFVAEHYLVSSLTLYHISDAIAQLEAVLDCCMTYMQLRPYVAGLASSGAIHMLSKFRDYILGVSPLPIPGGGHPESHRRVLPLLMSEPDEFEPYLTSVIYCTWFLLTLARHLLSNMPYITEIDMETNPAYSGENISRLCKLISRPQASRRACLEIRTKLTQLFTIEGLDTRPTDPYYHLARVPPTTLPPGQRHISFLGLIEGTRNSQRHGYIRTGCDSFVCHCQEEADISPCSTCLFDIVFILDQCKHEIADAQKFLAHTSVFCDYFLDKCGHKGGEDSLMFYYRVLQTFISLFAMRMDRIVVATTNGLKHLTVRFSKTFADSSGVDLRLQYDMCLATLRGQCVVLRTFVEHSALPESRKDAVAMMRTSCTDHFRLFNRELDMFRIRASEYNRTIMDKLQVALIEEYGSETQSEASSKTSSNEDS